MTADCTCDHCLRNFAPGDAILMDGQTLCPDCAQELTTLCSRCGDRIWNAEAMEDTNLTLCQDCYDDHYHTCADCGHIIHDDDIYYANEDEDTPYCSACVDRHRGDGVQSYYYKPEPIFYGNGDRYLGVELEIDEGGECDSTARKLMEIANCEQEHIYIKHDGSLNEGMEIVTHPMTLDYHKTRMPWAAVMQKALDLGYYSHRAETCGLHVHVNRDSLGTNSWEQELVVSRILYFVENHWNELLRFSRRTKHQLAKWASRYGRKDSPKEIMDVAKHASAGRYTCVNLTNSDTVEFRIFRGTLKYNTLIATLELVEEICTAAMYYTDEELAELSWTDFVSRLTPGKHQELITYLKERRLYVNEPLAEEEDA